MSKFIMFDGSKLDTQIATVARSGAKFQALSHKVAVSILSHIAKCGDYRHVVPFLNAMPKSARTNSLAKWFEQFGPLLITQEKNAYSVSFVKGKTVDLQGAIDMPYWEFKALEGVDYQPIDIIALLKKTVKTLEADAVKAKRNNDAVIAGLVLQIRTLELAKEAPVTHGGLIAGSAPEAEVRSTVQ